MVKNVYTTLSSESFDVSDIQFNKDGLVPVIAQCIHSGTILMMAWMNNQSVKKTIYSFTTIQYIIFLGFCFVTSKF